MNKIVLIGNGFDLAHGFKTGYGDFIVCYLKKRIVQTIDAGGNIPDDGLCAGSIVSTERRDPNRLDLLHLVETELRENSLY